MALIKCPECKKEISDSVDTCIHCGYRLNNKKMSLNIIDFIKLGIPMILVFILKKPILYFFYYLCKFLGLNTNSRVIGTYLYSIFHIGIMIVILYFLYNKIIKIKDKKKIIISLALVAILTSMTIFIIPSGNYNRQEKSETVVDEEKDEELASCSNKGYFINQLQADLYNSYGAYKDVVITGCDTTYVWEQLWVECKFKYRIDSSMEYKSSSLSERYSCKK